MKRATLLIFLLLVCSTNVFAVETKVKIPKEGWGITFDSPPLSKKQESKKDGGYAFRAKSSRFNISLFVEKPEGVGSSHKKCYEFFWPQASRNPMIAKDTILMTETKKYVRVQYDIVTKFQNQAIRMHNVNYYFSYGGKWVDVHISIIAPTEKDEKVFAAFDQHLRYGT